jgi:hydroxypyruvate isomerase
LPRFSANLGLLWPDRPLLQRIEAAARAGFRAIEMHWPYDVPASEIAALAYCLAYGGSAIHVMAGNVCAADRPQARSVFRAEPDEGEIAYRAIFDALDALGYRGWVGCEYRPAAIPMWA